MLEVSDPFGETMVSVSLTAGDAPLQPGNFRDVFFEWQDDPFVDDDIHDRLTPYTGPNLTISLASVQTC